jgi:hypothetical protein
MKKKTAAEPATVGDVDRCVLALEREIRRLVHLVGEDDEGVVIEAVYALYSVAELIAKPLAAAVKRPRSRVHLLRLVYLARVLGPKGSLATQKALYGITKLKGDDRLANAAAVVLSELLADEMESMAKATHRANHGERVPAVLDPMSIHHQGT